MIKVESYKCEKCGKLFATEAECVSHENCAVHRITIWWRPDVCIYTFSDDEINKIEESGYKIQVIESDRDLKAGCVCFRSDVRHKEDSAWHVGFWLFARAPMVPAATRYLKEWVMDTMKRSSDNASLLTEDKG